MHDNRQVAIASQSGAAADRRNSFYLVRSQKDYYWRFTGAPLRLIIHGRR